MYKIHLLVAHMASVHVIQVVLTAALYIILNLTSPDLGGMDQIFLDNSSIRASPM
jgi:hypothetical protein